MENFYKVNKKLGWKKKNPSASFQSLPNLSSKKATIILNYAKIYAAIPKCINDSFNKKEHPKCSDFNGAADSGCTGILDNILDIQQFSSY